MQLKIGFEKLQGKKFDKSIVMALKYIIYVPNPIWNFKYCKS